MTEQTIAIRGMHCQMCVGRLTTALKAVPGVSGVRVTLEPPRARVESEGPMSEAALVEARLVGPEFLVEVEMDAIVGAGDNLGGA